MKEEFKIETYLNENEIILYQGRPVVGKINKIYVLDILVLVFVIMIQTVVIVSSIHENGSILSDLSVVIILLISFAIAGYFIYEIIYKLFLRDKKIIDYEYYLTNERVIRYDQRKNKVISNKVINYDTVFIEQKKNGYGNVIFRFMPDDDSDSESGITITRSTYVNRGWPIIFESIENPDKVLDIVKRNYPKFK